jgi:hypothetical protein|tara:strand:+ start:78 stop:293 length:216 start_codon:yes stop_codon:yes gene_type:complete
MDINICIDHLGLNENVCRLDRNSPTPHVIIHWSGPDPQPTQAVLEAAWVEIEADPDYQAFLSDPHKNNYPV